MKARIKIKFCGLMREEDILAVNELLPDYAGFIFYEKSRRFISREKAGRFKQLLDKRIKAVGVFVDAAPDYIMSYLSDGIIDMVQLHGHEDRDYIRSLKKVTSAELIQAFQLKGDKTGISKALNAAAESGAEHILIDSGQGTGTAFDWELLRGFGRPFFLAGGLNTENVLKAAELVNPFALDLNSGIETDGKKDPEKMKKIMETMADYR